MPGRVRARNEGCFLQPTAGRPRQGSRPPTPLDYSKEVFPPSEWLPGVPGVNWERRARRKGPPGRPVAEGAARPSRPRCRKTAIAITMPSDGGSQRVLSKGSLGTTGDVTSSSRYGPTAPGPSKSQARSKRDAARGRVAPGRSQGSTPLTHCRCFRKAVNLDESCAAPGYSLGRSTRFALEKVELPAWPSFENLKNIEEPCIRYLAPLNSAEMIFRKGVANQTQREI